MVCGRAQGEALPRGAVLGCETGPYGMRCLVRRALVPGTWRWSLWGSRS